MSEHDMEREAALNGSEATEVEETSESESGQIKYQSAMALSEAASYFEAIVAALRKGQMTVSHGDTTLTLAPSDQVEVSVKAARKKGKEKIEFEVEWRQAPKSDLHISSE